MKTDDISSLLLLNKNKETQIFQSELTKYNPIQARLSSNIDAQKDYLNDLTKEFKKLISTSKGMNIMQSREQKKLDITQEWKVQYDKYKNAKDALKRGSGFYSHMKTSTDELKSKVIEFVNRRSDERLQLIKKIEDDYAAKGQLAMRQQLEKLSIHQQQPPRQPLHVPPSDLHSSRISAPLDQPSVPPMITSPVYENPPSSEYNHRPSMPPGGMTGFEPQAPPQMSPAPSQNTSPYLPEMPPPSTSNFVYSASVNPPNYSQNPKGFSNFIIYL